MQRYLLCFITFSLALTGSQLFAQKSPVDVARVDFNNKVRPFNWSNIVVEVEANSNPKPDAPNPKYVDNIRVIVTLGFEAENPDGFTFYQAEATLVTMEVGKNKQVGFWLPYDVVERDNLPKEPKYWLIELELDGEKVDLLQNNKSFSKNFASRASIEGFQSKANSKLADTEGILVPTYLSPNPYIEAREPPAYIRKEQQ